jgi:hypothetical protein
MLFHWVYDEAVYLTLLLVAAFAIWAFRTLKKQRKFVRIPLRILAVALISLDCLVFCLVLFFQSLTSTSRTEMVYSPDSRKAAQVTDFDYGATGGDTDVDLYSYWGIKKENIVMGTWKVVERKEVRWLSDRELLITYDGRFGQMPHCENAGSVVVKCIPAVLSSNAKEQADTPAPSH